MALPFTLMPITENECCASLKGFQEGIISEESDGT
jgi:hypothetical protein